MSRFYYLLLIITALIIPLQSYAQDGQNDPTKWEKDIQKFQEQDAENPQPRGAILFLGSSSIRMWDLERFFPDLQTINRGFGGSQIEDSIYYFDQLVKPYAPRSIVFYAGDNDINAGKTPQRVFEDFKTFSSMVHKRFPRTKIVFIAIKPSLNRWSKVEKMRKANRLIEDYIDQHKWMSFVNIDTPSLTAEGKPDKRLFKDDLLHLNDMGYILWSRLVLPHIK